MVAGINFPAANFTMEKDREVVQEIISKFFEVGFYNQKYYEIVITNKRLILVWIGESYKPWMLRIDPGVNKREEFEKLDINEIINYHTKNILINFEDIDFINLRKRTLFKNGYMHIKAKNFACKLYNKDKKVDYNKIFTTLEKSIMEKVSFE